MTKLYFIIMIISLTFPLNHTSPSIIEGYQYIRLNQPVYNAPKLVEFFSFYCPHCYQFEQVYHISQNIKQHLPKNINFQKYHINSLGTLGKQLTHAWAVAIALGIENKISPILFMAIQKQQSIHTIEDVRKIFIKSGIKAQDYDIAWNSALVQSLITNQEQAAINFHLQNVPAIFINGKYMIKNDKLDTSSAHAYIQQLSELLNLLLSNNNT